MDLGEKLKIFKEKGWICNPDTGEVWSHTGKLITFVKSTGYIQCSLTYKKEKYWVLAHQLVWFLSYNRIPKLIDHINGIRTDNRLINLRDVETNQKNQFNNKKAKGYTKMGMKYRTFINLNNKFIHIGMFDTEEEARQAYLDAKRIYHII